MRRHKIKQESAATSSHRDEEHDLAYYIHDRVELMHQVFSVIKPKELKAMAPNCVQLISIDNLQELCTEELLGISSKRLCAILDGAEPPTDTESSSSEQLETISLDSISSDDEILSQPASKKKHKHRKKNKAKSRHKHKHSSESEEDKDNTEKSKANRAGLTVLELLELQARARAIRAQLQKDNASKVEGSTDKEGEKEHSSDEVEIKEEPPEVFEISSDEEKPKLEELQKLLEKPSSSTEKISDKRTVTKTVTKVVNDLTITVPAKTTHKVKLNRNRLVKTTGSELKDIRDTVKENAINTEDTRKLAKDRKETKDKAKKKRKKNKNKYGSDHDEITLQLSDTEKMDLLEDLDRKNFDNFTSSEDSGSSSSENGTEKATATLKDADIVNSAEKNPEITVCEVNNVTDNVKIIDNNEKEPNEDNKEIPLDSTEANVNSEKTEDNKKETTLTESITEEATEKDNGTLESEDHFNTNEQMEDGEIKSNKELSEGEISDKDIIKESEKEIVCISDDEMKTHKKKKKKDKKSKKDKKKKSDFHESGDQNFFKENDADVEVITAKDKKQTEHIDTVTVDENFDVDFCDVLELSDSDYELDITVSQEPTADEIKALSAKIDEIDPDGQTDREVESWRDRYLDSKKVKKVLTTSNLLNALRKKNKELKNKLEVKPQVVEAEKKGEESNTSIDGTIEQFNTLQASTKYVDPVVEDKKNDEEVTKEMKKDAKQLLKMYKMLLKYNDINKQKDPNRKKKKKQKKSKEKKNVEDKCVS